MPLRSQVELSDAYLPERLHSSAASCLAIFRAILASADMRWLRKAADEGNAQAQFDYGRNLTLIPRRKEVGDEVVDWLQRASEARSRCSPISPCSHPL